MNRPDLLSNLDNPGTLEKMYRENKTAFKEQFHSLYPQISDNTLAAFWRERLTYESSGISWGSPTELAFVIIGALMAALVAQFPLLFNLNPELFYQRNIGFIVFPILTTYFIWKQKLSTPKIVIAASATFTSLIFINLVPHNNSSDTLMLSCIHLPLFLWSILGFTFVGNHATPNRRIDFLRYNGDLAIMCGLILISGGLLSAITMALFSVIGYDIEKFYSEYIIVCGLAAVPILGTYITQTNPQLVSKVSPVIARLFSPLVLITLVVYLAAIAYSGKDPYNDREFLMVFNVLLVGVMAIIFFSLSETIKKENRSALYILLALSIVTIIVNGIALSAIVFRISAWGITPNRLAITGGNILMLINLLIVTFRLFRTATKKADIKEVEHSISTFLPVYIIWTVVVIFIFPLLFRFR